MANYTNLWTNNHPVQGNNQARDLDDGIRRVRLDLIERILDIIGPSALSTDDPISSDSLEELRADVDTKPSINATIGKIPRKASASTLGDSSISDNGTDATVGRDLTVTQDLTVTRNTVLSGQVSAPAMPRFRITKSTNQQYNPSTNALVTFNTEVFDVGGNFASNKFTVPSGGDGLYLIGAILQPHISGSNFSFVTCFSVEFLKNGSSIGAIQRNQDSSGDGSSTYTSVNESLVMQLLIPLVAGDYIEVKATNENSAKTGQIGAASEFYGVRLW